jgi:rubrerythrin
MIRGKDERGALNLALKMEGKAYNLYHNLSEKAADSNARVVFKEMVEQEITHIDYLKKMRDKLTDAYK